MRLWILAAALALAPLGALAEDKPAATAKPPEAAKPEAPKEAAKPDPACQRLQEAWGIEAKDPQGAQFCDCVAQEIKRLGETHADMPVLKAAEAYAAMSAKAADEIEQGFADADPAATLSLAGYGYAAYQAAAQTCAPPEDAGGEDGPDGTAEENGFEPPEGAPKTTSTKPPKP